MSTFRLTLAVRVDDPVTDVLVATILALDGVASVESTSDGVSITLNAEGEAPTNAAPTRRFLSSSVWPRSPICSR